MRRPQLVANEVVFGWLRDPELRAVRDRGAREIRQEHLRGRHREHLRMLPQDLADRGLHVVWRIVIAGADLERNPRRRRRLREVRDRLLRHLAVGDDDEVALPRPDLRRAPGDLDHLAFEAGRRHPVADVKRLLDLDRQARKHVAQRVLQREADDDGADRRRRQELLIEHEGRDDEEEPDDDGVLDNRRKSIGRSPGPERIDGDQNDGVNDGERKQQPRNRLQVALRRRATSGPTSARAERADSRATAPA